MNPQAYPVNFFRVVSSAHPPMSPAQQVRVINLSLSGGSPFWTSRQEGGETIIESCWRQGIAFKPEERAVIRVCEVGPVFIHNDLRTGKNALTDEGVLLWLASWKGGLP